MNEMLPEKNYKMCSLELRTPYIVSLKTYIFYTVTYNSSLHAVGSLNNKFASYGQMLKNKQKRIKK